jgi:hypothetical protein
MGSTKSVVKNIPLISAVSMGATITSSVIDVLQTDNIGLQVTWTSANAVGTITVEGSVDYDPHFETGTFYALTFDPVLTQPNSDNGGYLVNINQFPWPYVRVVYTRSSGTGTLTVNISVKSI